MTRRLRPIFAVLPVTAAAAVSLAQSMITMRGGAAAPAGTPVSCNEQGVSVTPAAPPGAKPGVPSTISWDRVAAVNGALASETQPFADAAMTMWRARSRLDRGDVPGAEPLFESLESAYAGKQGPSSAVVCGGLLACRLSEGAQTAAVSAWLEYINALTDSENAALSMPAQEPGMLPAVDGPTQLAPLLPPMWVNVASLQNLARASASSTFARPRVATLAALYDQAAKSDAGLKGVLPAATSGRDDGVALVRDLVAGRIGDDAQRIAARQSLAARLKKRPALWVEVWCRVGIGRSLLKEPSRDAQILGVAELLEVAARFDRVVPYMTGLALAESAVALHGVGDDVGATRVRQELIDRFPLHPAIEWDALRSWANAAPAAPKLTVPQPSKTPDNPEGGPS